MIEDEMVVDLQSFIACKFICENCNSCYVGETTRHLSTESMNIYRETLKRRRVSTG